MSRTPLLLVARVYEVAKSFQGHLEPLRENWVFSLAYSKMALCQCMWYHTPQILHLRNARQQRIPSMVGLPNACITDTNPRQ